jgi:transcriptional regulator with GAF, ATPase, and Fis domain
MAARALLAAAAAFATAGATEEATALARDAAARAREGADGRAEAYACWAIADTRAAGDEEAAQAAERATRLLEDGSPEDRMRAAARLLRHRPSAIDVGLRTSFDETGANPATGAAARIEWWGARAEQLVRQSGGDALHAAASPVLTALAALAEVRAPIGSRGPALCAGHDLSARVGRGDLAARLLTVLGELARELVRRAPPELKDRVRSLPWVARAATGEGRAMRPEQARDLEALVRSFEDRERLGPLLNRVVDALVLWTGVERGLLLLHGQDGRLVPRAARNLARSDLHGEQLALSTTLARRAVDAREPVVAVDAAGEYDSLHQSVHSLKLRSVLAVPLIARGETLGVVYLDDRARRGAFGDRELGWTRTIASLAAIAIADARDRVLLRRAARQARRASERLAVTLAHREAALDAAERELAKARGERGTRFRYDAIVGESESVRGMLKLVDRVTASDVPVLVFGESGSGKELVARAIHNNGARAGHAFVSENCGAIPEGLLESALFGHVRGAFTGADRPHAGLFDVAHLGTLFLDEIGEMSLGMQAKLLRVLEDGLVRPLGSERSRKVDVRIITATHRDLEAMVREKSFREDLFYRLNIISIRIPPLRERPGDIPLIVHHLIDKHGGGRAVKVTRAAMDRLVSFSWPGNVRRLENEIRRALVLCEDVIDKSHLSAEVITGIPTPAGDYAFNVRRRIDGLERELVREALDRTSGNQTQAAKLLGLSRFGLQKMIKRLHIE